LGAALSPLEPGCVRQNSAKNRHTKKMAKKHAACTAQDFSLRNFQSVLELKAGLTRIALFVALMSIAELCSAGPWDTLARIFRDQIELRISVVDERQQPIPHTTLWFMYAYKEAPERSVGDMERLLYRYAVDYDLVLAGTVKPISAVHVYQTDATGRYQEVLEENNFRGLTELPVIVGVLKRGYRARAYAKTMPVGSTQELVIQLQRDETSIFDPRLLELDEIRSLANGVSLANGMEERAAYIDDLNERVVRLARTWEREGKQSLAAIAYFNLANLPSIDRMVDQNGKMKIVGYTRGYDEKSPVRKAYMVSAWEMGGDVPLLQCDAITKKFFEQKGGVWADASKTPMRRQYIADTEACVKSAGERVFPSTLLVLSQAYSAVGEHAMACDTLRRAYQFEPRSYAAKAWPGIFQGVEWAAKPRNGNFPAAPGFACAMPKL